MTITEWYNFKGYVQILFAFVRGNNSKLLNRKSLKTKRFNLNIVVSRFYIDLELATAISFECIFSFINSANLDHGVHDYRTIVIINESRQDTFLRGILGGNITR